MLTDWMSRAIPWAACACVNPISQNFSISTLVFTEAGICPILSPDTFARGLKDTLQIEPSEELLMDANIYLIHSSPAWLSACLLFQLKYYLQIISGVCFNLHGSSAGWGLQQGKNNCHYKMHILQCITPIKYTYKPLG